MAVTTGEYSSVSVEDPDSLAVVWGKGLNGKGMCRCLSNSNRVEY